MPARPRYGPIWLGGDSPRQMRRIGELAGGWLTHGNYLDNAREAAANAGRDPAALQICVTGIALLASDRIGQIEQRLHPAGMGVDHAIIGPYPAGLEDAPDLMQRFVEESLAELQAE